MTKFNQNKINYVFGIGKEQLLLHFDNMYIIHLWTIEKVEKQTNQAVYTSAVPAAKS